ncbi:hypothetical protein WICMUC_005522 [Wickerhamomyces mucosus]|uniref:Exocyst complex component SEC5 n=1 Tax=Wickerhamomyces mucosus TaxID=1378264 RepID=A0A9P8P7L7_9ASCO|nr:hypothetical protein WICMUC_005522 [Wickerhamomyces mucosus]
MDQEILDFYQLKTLNPQSWDDTKIPTNSISKHKSINEQSYLSENDGLKLLLGLVNEDLNVNENPTDPLNPKILIRQVIKDKDYLKFSINSKQFNSKQFLKIIHKDDSFEELSKSLNILENSIVEKNKELKSLIENEFIKFLRSKSSLDDVLKQFIDSQNKELGLSELNKSIADSNKEATILTKPIINLKQREVKLKQSIEFVEKNKFFFNLSKSLQNYIEQNDYDNFIHDYKRAKQLKDQLNNKIINRIWEDIENLVDSYKLTIWNNLNDKDFQHITHDDFQKNLKKLLELDSIDNPILEWIELQLQKFNSKVNELFNKYLDKIQNLQVNIQVLNNLDNINFLSNSLLSHKIDDQVLDSIIVLEIWLLTVRLFDELNKLIGNNFIKFIGILNGFINQDYKFDSNYIDYQYLKFEDYEIKHIKTSLESLTNNIVSKSLKYFQSNHLNKDSKGDGSLKDFGFLPISTNSLSAMTYLSKVVKSINQTLNSLGNISLVSDKSIDHLRDCSQLINERIISAICSCWINDCTNFYKLEKWNRTTNGTYLPQLIINLESFIIDGFNELLFQNLPKADNVQIVKYPSKKLLTGIQTQFLRSFDVLLESFIKKIIEENQESNTLSKKIKNFHKLLTLLNIKSLKDSIIPNSVIKFDEIFETNLSNQNLEIYELLNKMESTIFESFIKDQHKQLIKLINEGVLNKSWTQTNQPIKISSFIYEILNVLNNVYINVLNVSRELIPKIFQNLLEFISINLLKDYRQITTINEESLKQILLDLEFFQSILGNSIKKNGNFHKNWDLIFKYLFEDSQQLIVMKRELVEILDESLSASNINYEIFNNI